MTLSSVCCECGCSLMKAIKSHARTRLLIITLDKLMMTASGGPLVATCLMKMYGITDLAAEEQIMEMALASGVQARASMRG